MQNQTGRDKRRWLPWLILGAVVLALCYMPIRRSITTVRLLAVVRRAASGDSPPDAGVRVDRVARRMGESQQEAIVYRPSGSLPTSAVVLIPGVSELGCDHPRLVALARSLAGMGFLVLTPDIKMLREFRIYPPPLDDLSFWLHEVRQVQGGQKLRQVGMAGISFSATLAFIAAAQPQNHDLATYVLGIGAFDDLIRCSHFWFDSGPITVGPGYYPTRFYAKWIIMIAALDLLSAAEDRQFLEDSLRSLLLQKAVPPPPAGITEQGRRWYQLALMREDQADPELARQIETRVATMLYPGLATEPPGAEIRCPVFLAHGAYDDLIPWEESLRLKQKIVQAKSYLLVSPFLTHTHPWEKPLGWWTKTKAGLDVFVFFYHLTGSL